MRTGVKTVQTKAITYDMLASAYDILSRQGRFDSDDFKAHFRDQYDATPGRFSMVGGTLVELGIADIVPSLTEETCHYVATGRRY